MNSRNQAKTTGRACVLLALLAIGPRPASAQSWQGYGRDAQHSCLATTGSQMPNRVRWSASVDLNNPTGTITTHYGTPVITRSNNVIFPTARVTTQANPNQYLIQARHATNGALLWSLETDYAVPPHNWVPVCGITLTPLDRGLAIPAGGGTVLFRQFPDVVNKPAPARLAFYGLGNYQANPAAFNAAIQICTPITCDRLGTLYFGYVSSAGAGSNLPGYPDGIPSGLARIDANGAGSFISAANLAGAQSGNPPNQSVTKVVMNCAPALSTDGSTVYVAVNGGNFTAGYLCAVTSASLAYSARAPLTDPRTGGPAPVPDDGSGTPTVAPDGDVYFGVLEVGAPTANHDRGWLLHFSGDLSQTKLPSAFGWDDTASIVPKAAVPSYTGASSYLLLTKYNNYADPFVGADGQNKLALVDPNVSMIDPVTGVTVMNAFLTVLGPTFNQELNKGVREWCINSAAIDPVNKCAIVNSEDGRLYRWDFTANTLLPNNVGAPVPLGLYLAPPTGEAYTPTVIGPDGAVYAINNATLFSCVSQ